MTVQPDEYMPKTVEHCQFMNRFLARVAETDQTWAASDDFILVKPRLSVKLKVPPLHSPSPAAPKLGREVRVVATFTNPLSIDLTSCSFSVEGPGFIPPTKKHYRYRMWCLTTLFIFVHTFSCPKGKSSPFLRLYPMLRQMSRDVTNVQLDLADFCQCKEIWWH